MLVKIYNFLTENISLKTLEWTQSTFEDLLSWIGPIIQKPVLKRSSETLEGLCAALLYLATGYSETTIGTSCRISLLKKVSTTCAVPQNFRNFSDSFSTEHLRAAASIC